MENLEAIFGKQFELSKLDIGEFAKMKVGPMKFEISCYGLNGIGRLSIMKGKAMLGPMKMDVAMLTSFNKDMPLFNYDRIHAFKNDTILIECYDTLKDKKEFPTLLSIKEELKDIPNYELKKAWYDSIRLPCSLTKKSKKDTASFDEAAEAYIAEFCSLAKQAKDIDPNEKKALQASYVNGLLSHGGSSTDMFLKYVGQEKTEILYRQYLFGIS